MLMGCCASADEFKVVERKSSTHYVTVFTASYCGACHIFIDSPEFKRIKERYHVRVCNVEAEPKWLEEQPGRTSPRVERLPTIWLVELTEKRRVVREWRGRVRADEITVFMESSR